MSMIPGMNPRKMAQAMKRMGIQQQDIPATEVVIKCPDKELVITDPSVAKVNMMGQETIQITGNVHERVREVEFTISEDDVKTVMEQANVAEEAAREALNETQGDLAEAIMKFSEKE